MKHDKIPTITKSQADNVFSTGSRDEICRALLGIYELGDEHWEWVQATYLQFLKHEDEWVACAATTGLGHLARVSRRIDHEMVVPALKQISERSLRMKGKVSDALEDIAMFAK